jgi:tRNA dimethylallyltransferase
MINSGAVNEVKNFIKLKVKKDKSVNKAIGINEIRQYLKNEKDLYEISQQISIKTRQYAKRQSTWARGNMKTWLRLKPKHLNIFLNKI